MDYKKKNNGGMLVNLRTGGGSGGDGGGQGEGGGSGVGGGGKL